MLTTTSCRQQQEADSHNFLVDFKVAVAMSQTTGVQTRVPHEAPAATHRSSSSSSLSKKVILKSFYLTFCWDILFVVTIFSLKDNYSLHRWTATQFLGTFSKSSTLWAIAMPLDSENGARVTWKYCCVNVASENCSRWVCSISYTFTHDSFFHSVFCYTFKCFTTMNTFFSFIWFRSTNPTLVINTVGNNAAVITKVTRRYLAGTDTLDLLTR